LVEDGRRVVGVKERGVFLRVASEATVGEGDLRGVADRLLEAFDLRSSEE
jgi:hypothetical protein